MIPTDDEPAIGPAEPVEPTPPQPPAVTSSRPVTGLVALATSLLVLLGLFDTWFDFRKMAEPPRSDED